MHITDVKLRLLSRSMPIEGQFWEERLSRPLDIYPEHKAAPGLFGDIQPGEMSSYPIEAVFVQCELLWTSSCEIRPRASPILHKALEDAPDAQQPGHIQEHHRVAGRQP